MERSGQPDVIRDLGVPEALRVQPGEGGEAHARGPQRRPRHRDQWPTGADGVRRDPAARVRSVGHGRQAMTMFRRAGTACVAKFSAEEAQVLRQCVAELAALVSDDPDPDDPAVERLFPDVYPESPEDAAEFRRLTEADLKQSKLDHAKTVLSDLLEAGG